MWDGRGSVGLQWHWGGIMLTSGWYRGGRGPPGDAQPRHHAVPISCCPVFLPSLGVTPWAQKKLHFLKSCCASACEGSPPASSSSVGPTQTLAIVSLTQTHGVYPVYTSWCVCTNAHCRSYPNTHSRAYLNAPHRSYLSTPCRSYPST